MHLACMSSNPKILQELFDTSERREKLACIVNQPNANGDTPLMMACVAKNLDACMTLCRLGVDCKVKNKNGMTALMCAARLQESDPKHSALSVSILKQLLERLEADDINCVDLLRRNSAIHFAVQSGNTCGVEVLVKVPEINLHVYNTDGYTAYALAQHISAPEEMVQNLRENSEMKLALLDLNETECKLQFKKVRKKKSKTKRKQSKTPMDTAEIERSDVECDSAAVKVCDLEAIESTDGVTALTDRPETSYDELNAFFHYLNPLAQEIAVNVDAFVVSCPRPILPEPDLDRNIEQIMSSLSISQVEILESAHLCAYNALNERKLRKIRELEAQRVEEKLALKKILTLHD
uniref:AlNc14C215G9001 protein n=1 Tax=Albugo laibachii Nc14 TaxID=890382 RepID=F0WRK1_9STRA|nr:AlNc14C215G9001 [Albugo laibachii Nc14]|eukprot:CCA23964.1 AlNc14C215G9001 [Albugo laibachii Nc14]